MIILKQFFEPKTNAIGLGPQDFAVLDSYRSFEHGACVADVYSHLKRKLRRDPRLPTIYQIVLRMTELGLLEDAGESPAPRGGRPRRLFKLTPTGLRAISLAESMLQARAVPA